MAKFCEDNCKARCEFCINYKDETEIVGFCEFREMNVDGSDGYDCDYFECINIK